MLRDNLFRRQATPTICPCQQNLQYSLCCPPCLSDYCSTQLEPAGHFRPIFLRQLLPRRLTAKVRAALLSWRPSQPKVSCLNWGMLPAFSNRNCCKLPVNLDSSPHVALPGTVRNGALYPPCCWRHSHTGTARPPPISSSAMQWESHTSNIVTIGVPYM